MSGPRAPPMPTAPPLSLTPDEFRAAGTRAVVTEVLEAARAYE